MKLVKALIWPVITYGAEGWTLKKDDERRLEAAEMWCYRRMLRISWTKKRTNKSILNELQTRRELLAQIIKRKMAFFGHACRNNKCKLVKTCILGMLSGKRRRGRPRKQYVDNIKKWTRASLEETVNSILHREKSKRLPDHTSLDALYSSLSKLFTDNITLIRSNFVTNDHSHNFPEPPHVENIMDQFTPTTTSAVQSIILKSTNASCDLDPFPTRLLNH